jgi:hypothetical protein
MYWLTMRLLPDDQRGEWVREMRARARRDAEVLTPRPGQPIYGLAAPALRPAAVTQYQLSYEKWIGVTLTYGQPDAPEGPCVVVTTVAAEAAESGPTPGDGLEAELRYVVEGERDRVARRAGAAEPGTAAPLVVGRETLPAGRALVCRSGSVWAARLLPADPPAGAVVVTIVALGVNPESVRLQPIADLRPMIEAEVERIIAMMGRSGGKPRPPRPEPEVELEPAEGVTALRALAEFTLKSGADRRARLQAGQRRRHDPDWGRLHNALWQRAVREHQRLRGTAQEAADDAVTAAVNHLGLLQEKAPWFGADPRLRAAAVDETLRHTMLGDAVTSEPAQDAWARSWSTRVTGRRPDREADREAADPLVEMAAREALSDDCLRAWAAWAETA